MGSMTKVDMRFLVPSAGAGSSISVIKAIVGQGGFVLAVDMDQASAGLFLANKQALVPRCSDHGYVQRILDLCAWQKIQIVIPINDLELKVFNRADVRNQFRLAGVHLAMNPHPCVHAGICKKASWAVVNGAGLLQPYTFSTENLKSPRHFWRSLTFPLIVKPAQGVGGQGQKVANCLADVKQPPFQVPTGYPNYDYLWQDYIHGVEYSVDTWGDPFSERFVAVPRLRQEVRFGQITKGQTVDDAEVIHFVRQICQAFKSKDVCCVQVIRCAKSNRLYFIEMNPRYGTGVSLSIAAGANFPLLQWLQVYIPDDIQRDMLAYEPNLRMLRHWQEIYWRKSFDGTCSMAKIGQG